MVYCIRRILIGFNLTVFQISVDLSVGALGLLLSALAEVLTTFFQHRHITFIISLVLGWLLALIISVILFFYIMWASGNMVFVK